MGIPEKIERIQEELHRTKINKATEHHVGLLKAKLAKLKLNVAETHGKANSRSYAVKRSGDATVTVRARAYTKNNRVRYKIRFQD